MLPGYRPRRTVQAAVRHSRRRRAGGGARLIDRAGKGIRGAIFGLRQSLDTAGAFIRSVLAIGLMLLLVKVVNSSKGWYERS